MMKKVRSLNVLLERIVDYAGLFPPSSLPMGNAVENYARYRHSQDAWMLGKFVAPVARLDEFEANLPASESNWEVTALVGSNLDADLQRITRFQAAAIDGVEVKAANNGEIESIARRLPANFATYFEIPSSEDPRPLLAAIRRVGARAKIRTGGIAPDLFPSPAHLARFIVACAETGVAFKATAGLHHPFRCRAALTYSSDGPSGWMFGFLNVFVAAVFARQGLGEMQIAELLVKKSLDSLRFEDDAIHYGTSSASIKDIFHTRRDFAISFGSCSFEEPVEDLRAIGLL
jgi:hypothetical protein